MHLTGCLTGSVLLSECPAQRSELERVMERETGDGRKEGEWEIRRDAERKRGRRGWRRAEEEENGREWEKELDQDMRMDWVRGTEARPGDGPRAGDTPGEGDGPRERTGEGDATGERNIFLKRARAAVKGCVTELARL